MAADGATTAEVAAEIERRERKRRDSRDRQMRQAGSGRTTASRLSALIRTYKDTSSPGALVQGTALQASNEVDSIIAGFRPGTRVTVESNWRAISGGTYSNPVYEYAAGTYTKASNGRWVHVDPKGKSETITGDALFNRLVHNRGISVEEA